MTPAEANRQHEEAGFRAGAGGKDAVGQVTPAQVFLQLYHTHPLIMESQDLPLHVPSNEVRCTGVQRGLHYPLCVCVCVCKCACIILCVQGCMHYPVRANVHALSCVCKEVCIILCVCVCKDACIILCVQRCMHYPVCKEACFVPCV